ncbi:MAG: hypothetical protein ACJZ57_03520 [Candidatus Poriferisodalaceae bacterium]
MALDAAGNVYMSPATFEGTVDFGAGNVSSAAGGYDGVCGETQ